MWISILRNSSSQVTFLSPVLTSESGAQRREDSTRPAHGPPAARPAGPPTKPTRPPAPRSRKSAPDPARGTSGAALGARGLSVICTSGRARAGARESAVVVASRPAPGCGAGLQPLRPGTSERGLSPSVNSYEGLNFR